MLLFLSMVQNSFLNLLARRSLLFLIGCVVWTGWMLGGLVFADRPRLNFKGGVWFDVLGIPLGFGNSCRLFEVSLAVKGRCGRPTFWAAARLLSLRSLRILLKPGRGDGDCFFGILAFGGVLTQYSWYLLLFIIENLFFATTEAVCPPHETEGTGLSESRSTPNAGLYWDILSRSSFVSAPASLNIGSSFKSINVRTGLFLISLSFSSYAYKLSVDLQARNIGLSGDGLLLPELVGLSLSIPFHFLTRWLGVFLPSFICFLISAS